MSVKDTKEEALPIDSVRRAKVALIEDWSPVTNTIQHNTRYTIDALQSHNMGWRNSARSGHDEQLVPLLLALQRVRPHHIPLQLRLGEQRAPEHYIALASLLPALLCVTSA